MPRFLIAGVGHPGKTAVKASPVYGKVPEPKVNKRGLLTLAVKPDDSGLELVGVEDLGGDANWVEMHPSNGHVYATWNTKVGAFSIGGDGKLTLINTSETIGTAHHLTFSEDGKWLLSVGYMSMTVMVFPVAADGSVGPATDSKLHDAPMVERLADRQEQCHPHQIRFHGPWALCCDLGADRVWIYAFDETRGGLVGALNSERHARFPEGSGPRHLEIHPSGRWVFVLCELDSNLVTCEWDAAAGSLTPKSSAYVLPEGMKGCRAHHSGACAIRMAPSGEFIYVSHRTDDSLVVFGVDGASGALRKLQAVPCGGLTPRDMVLDWPMEAGAQDSVKRRRQGPGKRFLHVTNQCSQLFSTFEIGADGLFLEKPPASLGTPGLCPCALAPVVDR